MSTRRRYVLWGGLALLLLGVATALVGVLLGGESRDLLADGRETPATIARKTATGVGGRRTYRLEFAMATDRAARASTRVTREVFDAHVEGQAVTITYLPGATDVAVLGDREDVQALGMRAALAVWGGGGVTVVALGLLALVCVRRH